MKLKEFSIQGKSLILDLCNILYLDISHAGFVLACFISNLQKPIPAIEDTQHYPCLNFCLANRCMKHCYAILSKLLILSQYLNHDVDCMLIVMYHWLKSENCNMNVKEPSKLQKNN